MNELLGTVSICWVPPLYTEDSAVSTSHRHKLPDPPGESTGTQAFTNLPNTLIHACRANQKSHTCPAMFSLHHHDSFLWSSLLSSVTWKVFQENGRMNLMWMSVPLAVWYHRWILRSTQAFLTVRSLEFPHVQGHFPVCLHAPLSGLAYRSWWVRILLILETQQPWAIRNHLWYSRCPERDDFSHLTPACGFRLGNFITVPTALSLPPSKAQWGAHQQSSRLTFPFTMPICRTSSHAQHASASSSHSLVLQGTVNCKLHICQEQWALLGLYGSTFPALHRDEPPSLEALAMVCSCALFTHSS